MLNTYLGKNYDMIGALLGWVVFPFKFHFLVDINLVDINAYINTATALFSLIASAAGVLLTCAKVAEMTSGNRKNRSDDE